MGGTRHVNCDDGVKSKLLSNVICLTPLTSPDEVFFPPGELWRLIVCNWSNDGIFRECELRRSGSRLGQTLSRRAAGGDVGLHP